MFVSKNVGQKDVTMLNKFPADGWVLPGQITLAGWRD